ncbi:hypothetical protein [Desulfonema limicola]|nr:hypothetical protein [Desulfonema limicola]
MQTIGSLSGALANHGNSQYGRLFQRFYNKKRIFLEIFLELRNRYAHGALQDDKNYSEIINKNMDYLIDILQGLNFLIQLLLVRADNLRFIEDKYLHQVRLCMGDNYNFSRTEIALHFPLECDKFYLLKEDYALLLHPLIIEQRCQMCGQQEIFLYNRIEQNNVSYLSYRCGHQFETAQYTQEIIELLGI